MKKWLIGRIRFKCPLRYGILVTLYFIESFYGFILRCHFPPSNHCIHPLFSKTSTWKIPFQWKNEIEYTPQVTQSSKDILLLKENLWQERTFGIHIPLIYCASLHNVFFKFSDIKYIEILKCIPKEIWYL